MEITLVNISKSYKNTKAVKDVNLTLTNGITALLGANGSGKTTLLRTIARTLAERQRLVAVIDERG